MQVRYRLADGVIDQWGERCEPTDQHGILDNVPEDVLDVVSIAGKVINGQLVLDEELVRQIKQPAQPLP